MRTTSVLFACALLVLLGIAPSCQPPGVGVERAEERKESADQGEKGAIKWLEGTPEAQEASPQEPDASERRSPDQPNPDQPMASDETTRDNAPDTATTDRAMTPETPREMSPNCSANERRCAGSGFQECAQGRWGSAKDCPKEHSCQGTGSNARCVPKQPPTNPCTKSCWQNDTKLTRCGFYTQQEDFASGRYNVHQYDASLASGVTVDISLRRLAGNWQPALVVALADGTRLTPAGVGPPTIRITTIKDGRSGEIAQYRLSSNNTQKIVVYVTGWSVVDSQFTNFLPKSVEYDFQIVSQCGTQQGQHAPANAMTGEQLVHSGSVNVAASTTYGTPYRVDAAQGEHISFRLLYSGSSKPTLEVLAWDGKQTISLGTNNWGPNLRALAALDTKARRTFWARVKGLNTKATLRISRVPFVDAIKCTQDCDRLMQLPLPMDRNKDGYYTHPDGKYLYQFGRRDLVMTLREAGKRIAKAGYKPCPLKDFSKWDGSRPPGHASHTQGEDIDTCVFQLRTGPQWKPLCRVDSKSECVKGSDLQFDGTGMALFLAGFLDSDRIVYVFLDREFLPKIVAAAEALIKAKKINAALLPAFKTAVRHWPNHHNHAHIRISDKPYP